MDRRRFMEALGRFAGAGISSVMVSSYLLADMACTPYNQAGVQQCQVGINSSLIPVTAFQQMPEWRWAASISMVFRYYGFRVSQQRIVQETWGAIANLPGAPGQILSDLNRPWKDDDNKRFTATGETYDANPATAAQDLSQDMPLIIGALGHAI
jgi:hypothetical protein